MRLMDRIMLHLGLLLMPLLVCSRTNNIFIWQETLIFLFGLTAALQVARLCLKSKFQPTLFSLLAPLLLSGFYLFHHLPVSMVLPRFMALICLFLLWRRLDIAIDRYVPTIALSMVLLNAYLVVQHLGIDFMDWSYYGLRNAATFGNPNLFAAFINANLFLLILSALKSVKARSRYLVFLAMGLSLFSYMITASRSGMLALLIGLVLLVVLRKDIRHSRRFWRIAALLFLCAALVFLALPVTFHSLAARLLAITDDPGIHLRYHLYRAAGAMILSNPLTGVGINRFGQAFMLGKSPAVDDILPLDQGHTHVAHCHNDGINILAEGGLLYFALFAGLVFMAAWGYKRSSGQTTLLHGIWLGWLCLLVQSLFTMPSQSPALMFTFFLWSALLARSCPLKTIKSAFVRYLQIPAVLLCIGLCAHGTVVFLHTQYGMYISATRQAAGDSLGAREALQQVVAWDTHAVDAYTRLGRLQFAANDAERGTDNMAQAARIAPYMQLARFNYIVALYKTGKTQQVMRETEDLLRYYPHYLPAALMKGVMLKDGGKPRQADEMFTAILKRNCFHSEALQYYIALTRRVEELNLHTALLYWLRNIDAGTGYNLIDVSSDFLRKTAEISLKKELKKLKKRTAEQPERIRQYLALDFISGARVPYMEMPSRRYVMCCGRDLVMNLQAAGAKQLIIHGYVPLEKVKRKGFDWFSPLRITIYVNGRAVHIHDVRASEFRIRLDLDEAAGDGDVYTLIHLAANFAYYHSGLNRRAAYCLTNLELVFN